MPLGDRKITLHKPGVPVQDAYGEVIIQNDEPYTRWATRRDRSASSSAEGTVADTEIGEWTTVFRVRTVNGKIGGEQINNSWLVRDSSGQIWDIERVSEVSMPRLRWVDLFCVLRTAGLSGPIPEPDVTGYLLTELGDMITAENGDLLRHEA